MEADTGPELKALCAYERTARAAGNAMVNSKFKNKNSKNFVWLMTLRG
ncbi:hypothetical protein FHS10_005219 [Mucilaginibacter dorajii]|nr:hypothetical protein [Mucilaginibacter dorajii]